MNQKAQATQLLLLLFVMVIFIFIFSEPGIRLFISVSLDTVLYPLIGFQGQYPILTIVLAGIIMVLLSSFFTNLFTDWKAMGRAQEISRAFQKEMSKARRDGNTNRVQKLMKKQPEILRMTTESSSGMMKPMFFLFIFIAPIFMWLLYFFSNVRSYFFTVPWSTSVSLFDRSPVYITNWFLLYLIFSLVVGQFIRQGLKWISWSSWWQTMRNKIRRSPAR